LEVHISRDDDENIPNIHIFKYIFVESSHSITTTQKNTMTTPQKNTMTTPQKNIKVAQTLYAAVLVAPIVNVVEVIFFVMIQATLTAHNKKTKCSNYFQNVNI
jgi:hypothetical protein